MITFAKGPDDGPCLQTNVTVVMPSRFGSESEPECGACSPKGSLCLSDDEAEQTFLEEFGI